MVVYQVRPIDPAIGLDRIIEVPDSEYILNMAEQAGIRLSSNCKQGEGSVGSFSQSA